MTRTVEYAVESYQICLGQTKLDLAGSRDPDDFRNGSGFFVELKVSVKPGFRTRFRELWFQIECFTLYFEPDENLAVRDRGRVSREWDDDGRILSEAYARFAEGNFGPMQDWLQSNPKITLTLFGEDNNSEVARCRLEGDATTL